MTDKKMKIEFAPGCFDNFDGTQEELEEFIKELEKMVEDGSLIEDSEPLDLEALADEDPAMFLQVVESLGILDEMAAEGDPDAIDLLEELGKSRKNRLN